MAHTVRMLAAACLIASVVALSDRVIPIEPTATDVCDQSVPVDPIWMRAVGIYDTNGGETTPFMWYGKLLLVESVATQSDLPFAPPVFANCTWPAGSYAPPRDDGRCPYLRIRQPNMEFDTMTGQAHMDDTLFLASIPGSADVTFCNAHVNRNDEGLETLWVFGTNNNDNNHGDITDPDRSLVWGFWSSDPNLRQWQSKVVLNFTEHDSDIKGAYNVDVTSRPDGTSIMAVEKAPDCCYTYFAECKDCGEDLSSGWKPMPVNHTAAGFGETANPTIRYLPSDGYYYLVVANGRSMDRPAPLPPSSWNTFIMRSKDLINWELSSNQRDLTTQLTDQHIIPGSALDKLGNQPDCMPFCNKSFALDPTNDIDMSDMDFNDWILPDGSVKMFATWTTGNQGTGPANAPYRGKVYTHGCPHGCGMSAAGVADASTEDWLKSYFPPCVPTAAALAFYGTILR